MKVLRSLSTAPGRWPGAVALLSLLNRGAEDLLIGANSPIAAEVALTDSAAGGSVLKALVLGPKIGRAHV